MSIPEIYTDGDLADFMISELRSVATNLGWTCEDMYGAVDNAVVAYGETDIANCTNIPKIRALAKVEAWKAVVAEVSGDYDFSDGDASYKAVSDARTGSQSPGYGFTGSGCVYPTPSSGWNILSE